jgi:predicted transcriptional regulator
MNQFRLLFKRKNRLCKKHQEVYKEVLRMRTKFTFSEIEKKTNVNRRTVSKWLETDRGSDKVRVRLMNLKKYRRAIKLKKESWGILSSVVIARIVNANPRTVRVWFKKECLCSVRRRNA